MCLKNHTLHLENGVLNLQMKMIKKFLKKMKQAL